MPEGSRLALLHQIMGSKLHLTMMATAIVAAKAWVYLVGLGFILWGLCGSVIAIGRKLWSFDTTLRIHLVAAPLLAFVISLIHKLLAPGFDTVLRATVMTALIAVLDAAVVAPALERSYMMFRNLIGTWLPFAAIFLSSVVAGILNVP